MRESLFWFGGDSGGVGGAVLRDRNLDGCVIILRWDDVGLCFADGALKVGCVWEIPRCDAERGDDDEGGQRRCALRG